MRTTEELIIRQKVSLTLGCLEDVPSRCSGDEKEGWGHGFHIRGWTYLGVGLHGHNHNIWKVETDAVQDCSTVYVEDSLPREREIKRCRDRHERRKRKERMR